MAWLFGQDRKTITGFDTGSSHIHVMQAAVNQGALHIHHLQSIERSQEPLANQLAVISSSLPKKVKTASVSLPIQDTLFHPMLLPPLEEKDIRGFVKFELAKQLDTEAEHISADFTYCEAEQNFNGDARRAIGIGIKKKTVDTLLTTFETQRIRVLFAEASPMAMLNCMFACYPQLKQKTVMCMNLESGTISVVIAANGYPIFIRKIPAEPIYNVINQTRTVDSSHPILKEINRTLLYYQTHIQQVELETVLLTGNGCNVSHIESFGQDSLPFTIKAFNILNCASDQIQLHLTTTPMTPDVGLSMTNAAGLLFRMANGDS